MSSAEIFSVLASTMARPVLRSYRADLVARHQAGDRYVASETSRAWPMRDRCARLRERGRELQWVCAMPPHAETIKLMMRRVSDEGRCGLEQRPGFENTGTMCWPSARTARRWL